MPKTTSDTDLQSRLHRRQWITFTTTLALFGLFMVAAGEQWDIWAFAALVTIALGTALCVAITCPRCHKAMMFHAFAWRPRKKCPHCNWPETGANR